jgi:histidine triad (HIT) family protein
MADKCVFCDIISKKTKAFVIYEDLNTVSFLDIMPRSTGMTIVAPKQHYTEFDENHESSTATFQSAQIVAKMIKKGLNPITLDFSIIPSQEVPHFHIRLYPVYDKEIPLVENQPKQATEQELNEVMNKIKSIHIEMPKRDVHLPEVKEEKPREPERSKEDVYWIRRESEVT